MKKYFTYQKQRMIFESAMTHVIIEETTNQTQSLKLRKGVHLSDWMATKEEGEARLEEIAKYECDGATIEGGAVSNEGSRYQLHSIDSLSEIELLRMSRVLPLTFKVYQP